MVDTFFHQHFRILHQIENGVLAIATEYGLNTRQIGQEEFPEIRDVYHLCIDGDICNTLGIQPGCQFLHYFSCTFDSLYSMGVRRR